jgi:hypothetical protein
MLAIGAGWIIQVKRSITLSAGRGVAVREFPLKSCIRLSSLSHQHSLGQVGRMLFSPHILQAIDEHRSKHPKI